MAKLPTLGLGIDFETSGLSWDQDSSIEYQGISFGAVIFDTTTLLPLSTIYREIKFNSDKYKWSDSAEKVHGLSREHLDKEGISIEEAACDLAEFILQNFGPASKVIFLGHNTDFDISFCKQLLEPFDLMPKLHHVVLDVSSLGLLTIGLYSSNDVFEFLGFPKRDTHHALEDILQTLESARRIKMIVNNGLGI